MKSAEVKKYASMNPNEDQRKYLLELFDKVAEFQHACNELNIVICNGLYGKDSDGIDINDYISPKYPSIDSFDEFTERVQIWKESVQERIGLATYQPETK